MSTQQVLEVPQRVVGYIHHRVPTPPLNVRRNGVQVEVGLCNAMFCSP